MASSTDGLDGSRRVGTGSAANPHPERDSGRRRRIVKGNAPRPFVDRLGEDWARSARARSMPSGFLRRRGRGGAVRERLRAWTTPAGQVRDEQPALIPVDRNHDGVAVGQVVHLEHDGVDGGLWCVAEVADHVRPAVQVKVGEDIATSGPAVLLGRAPRRCRWAIPHPVRSVDRATRGARRPAGPVPGGRPVPAHYLDDQRLSARAASPCSGSGHPATRSAARRRRRARLGRAPGPPVGRWADARTTGPGPRRSLTPRYRRCPWVVASRRAVLPRQQRPRFLRPVRGGG